jgi:arylsulfatase A-like enzyme
MNLDRRTFLATMAAAAARAQGVKRPNILFLFSDDHAYQAISAYGSRLNRTPHIDRIANEGVRFDNALVTNSICAPSRAVILTGKYSHLNGVIDNAVAFDGSQQTFPKLLQKAGYQTAIFGKWHLKSDPTGFDDWEVLPGQGHYYNPDFITPSGTKRIEGYCTEIIADRTIDWLKSRDKSKPFLLMSQHKAPHRNWMPAPSKLYKYDGVTFPEPETLFDNYEHRASPAHNQEMEIGRHMTLGEDLKVIGPGHSGPQGELKRMTPEQRRIWDAAYNRRNAEFFAKKPSGKDLVRWKYQRYMQDYLACIDSVDDAIGRVLAELDASGEAANTLVIYASDQGFYLGEHGWFDKRWIYEESIRTPLVMRWPGVIRPGSVRKEMVANIDLPETFLEAAGAPPPADMQGRSLMPLLKGETPPDWRKTFYYHYYENVIHNVAPHDGVRTERYTLANYYESGEWELFDREKDPHQLRSVYSDPSYAAVVKELKAALERHRKELQVPTPKPA